MLGLFTIISTISMVFARSPYQFPADTELTLSQPLSTAFSCEGYPYGYYADVNNNCEVFHVCMPVQDDLGVITETAQFSFICGNQTIFSQDTLTCQSPEVAFPCLDAEGLYTSVNSEFGQLLIN